MYNMDPKWTARTYRHETFFEKQICSPSLKLSQQIGQSWLQSMILLELLLDVLQLSLPVSLLDVCIGCIPILVNFSQDIDWESLEKLSSEFIRVLVKLEEIILLFTSEDDKSRDSPVPSSVIPSFPISCGNGRIKNVRIRMN